MILLTSRTQEKAQHDDLLQGNHIIMNRDLYRNDNVIFLLYSDDVLV